MRTAPLLICVVFVGCQSTPTALTPDPRPRDAQDECPIPGLSPDAIEVVPIPLAGVFARREAELSSLAWWHDDLVLCPQYPARFTATKPDVASWAADVPNVAPSGNATAVSAAGAVGGIGRAGGLGALAAIPKATLLAHLDGRDASPVEPRAISFDDGGLSTTVQGFEGFESLVFSGDRAYLTVEKKRTAGASGVVGNLVAGVISNDGRLLQIDPASIQDLPVPVALPNMGFEAMSLVNNTLLTFFEANGSAVLDAPITHRFSISPGGALLRRPSIPFPNIDYRITAATAPDAQGRIWALNIYWKGEPFLCRAGANDAEKNIGIEQLVELQVTDTGVYRTQRPPLVLRTDTSGKARNWEGLARIEGRGFLVVTDEYPDTRLGFVPFVE